ncbi:MAG: NUDIX hydrolase [Clostridia bacterium]|nr:NUDIX hydrolase [Clostridia bacterium]MCR4887101.1 NUDIX hydrolase [Clostridiales bacterium]
MLTDESLRETFLSSQEIYPGKIIRVEKWQVSLPNGETALREIVRHNGAAAIVPVDREGNVTLVRQHRIAVDRFTWEIPAGKLDSQEEDPFHAAQRELEEETGLQAGTWRQLTLIDTTPGFCNEHIAIYLATDLSQHPAHPDADEFLRITKMPLQEAVARCMSGEFHDSKTVIGLLMANQVLQAGDRACMPSLTAIQRSSMSASSRMGK